MSASTELDTFRGVWDAEAERTVQLLEVLPADQYDFRPDPAGRSLGEMAWHLAEIDACLSFALEHDRFLLSDQPPNLERPRETALLAPGYRRVHDEAKARIAKLGGDDLERHVSYFDGRQVTVREVLWNELLHHAIHHRAQLVLLCRQAGGAPPGLYGPNREEMQAMKERMSAGG